jgi:hypothetical protein
MSLRIWTVFSRHSCPHSKNRPSPRPSPGERRAVRGKCPRTLNWSRTRSKTMFNRLARTCSVYPGRPRGRLVCGVGVPAKACRNFVAEGNCVAVRRGGEQPEANRRSEGARTRFGANPWRAGWVRAKPGTTAGAETTVEKRPSEGLRGWGRNDGKARRSKRRDPSFG